MTVRSTAKAEWHGSLKEGKGDMHLARGNYTGEFTRASRFETGQGTNPEELLAAAHAGCFSMQLSALLSDDGHPPKVIRTKAHVTIVPLVAQRSPCVDERSAPEMPYAERTLSAGGRPRRVASISGLCQRVRSSGFA